MRKLMLALLAAALAIALLGVACGDDDEGTSPTETESTATDRATRTEPAETTPANGDQKTPGNETPDESTPEPTEPGVQPTPASVGTPATFIADPAAFFSTNYPGKQTSESECGFSPVTFVVTCGSDKYAPNPPLTGQDVACFLLSVDGVPVAIRCTSQEPLQSIYYEIQE